MFQFSEKNNISTFQQIQASKRKRACFFLFISSDGVSLAPCGLNQAARGSGPERPAETFSLFPYNV